MKFIKTFILLFIYATIIQACSNNNNEEDFTPTESFSCYYYINAQDSIHLYGLREAQDDIYNLIKSTSNTWSADDIIWQNEIKLPNPIKINAGYGEYKEITFHPSYIIGDNNNLLFISYNTNIDDYYVHENIIGIYNTNGNFITHETCKLDYNYQKGIVIMEHTLTRWINNSTIISFIFVKNPSIFLTMPYEELGYIIIDKNGQVIKRKENVTLTPCKDPNFIWEEGYSFIASNKFIICNLETGSNEISINDIISSHYPEEAYPPKVNITNISSQGDIAILNIDATLYNGQHVTDIVKINYKTGEEIKS